MTRAFFWQMDVVDLYQHLSAIYQGRPMTSARRLYLLSLFSVMFFLLFGCGNPPSYPPSYSSPVPATGLKQCYDMNGTVISCANTGQDAAYMAHNPMSYTDNRNGTVTDNVTGLMWQQSLDGIQRSWSDAGAYCSSLATAGYSDWRLPSVMELQSIVDYSIAYPGPTTNTTYFPNLVSNPTTYLWDWSSNSNVSGNGTAGSMDYSGGVLGYSSASSPLSVRCVRGNQFKTGNFVDNGDSTITDLHNGLMWQQTEGGVMPSWGNALSYCAGLGLAGHSDWRLPNIKELTSIVDYATLNTTYFPNAVVLAYWSSTTNAEWTNAAWQIYFIDGSSSIQGKATFDSYVRCVRTAP